MSRVEVRKTHKLFIGGAFPRSESGRTYEVTDANGEFIANVAQASRKDARDAVLAARSAFAKWSTATAYNRGQVLYRIAEVMEGRRDQFIAEIEQGEGVSAKKAAGQLDAAIDRWVWYAGWADKYAQVIGNTNPVAGPYFNFSIPEPTGVVVAVAPQDHSILGLTSVVAPIIVTGNACVVMPSPARPVPAITLAECLATSDVPGGVVNILTGAPAEVMPWLAEHADVNALDLTGIVDESVAADLERQAAGTVKRVRGPKPDADWHANPTLSRIRSFTEIKTVWHPLGT
ncbi:MAG TPA: aldehyde dehydrogenase family protein [Candidatus Nanopelagicales bacterium]|nr:aldehyde dehydrogenase family protein [Candidatus Nanopelagicales bacterium]